MKIILALFLAGSLALIIHSGYAYGESQARHAAITCQIQHLRNDLNADDFDSRWPSISRIQVQIDHDFKSFIWAGLLGVVLSLAGIIFEFRRSKPAAASTQAVQATAIREDAAGRG